MTDDELDSLLETSALRVPLPLTVSFELCVACGDDDVEIETGVVAVESRDGGDVAVCVWLRLPDGEVGGLSVVSLVAVDETDTVESRDALPLKALLSDDASEGGMLCDPTPLFVLTVEATALAVEVAVLVGL